MVPAIARQARVMTPTHTNAISISLSQCIYGCLCHFVFEIQEVIPTGSNICMVDVRDVHFHERTLFPQLRPVKFVVAWKLDRETVRDGVFRRITHYATATLLRWFRGA